MWGKGFTTCPNDASEWNCYSGGKWVVADVQVQCVPDQAIETTASPTAAPDASTTSDSTTPDSTTPESTTLATTTPTTTQSDDSCCQAFTISGQPKHESYLLEATEVNSDGVIFFSNAQNKVHLSTVYGRYWALSDNGSGGFSKKETSHWLIAYQTIIIDLSESFI